MMKSLKQPSSHRKARTRQEIEPILAKITTQLKALYGKRFVNAILYGSFVRNQATSASDIDIAIVLKGEVHPYQEINAICDALYELGLETGELISVYPLSEEQLKSPVWPLYAHISQEGIRL